VIGGIVGKTALGSSNTTNWLVFVMHELIVFCEAVRVFLLNRTQINVSFLRGKESFSFINHVGVTVKVASSRCLHRTIDVQVTEVDTLPDGRSRDGHSTAGPYA